jgi:hypothetical protein
MLSASQTVQPGGLGYPNPWTAPGGVRYKVGMSTRRESVAERVDGPTSDGERICHIVTDEDPDTALCGKDVTGWPWNPPWPYCVVCLDLAGIDPV